MNEIEMAIKSFEKFKEMGYSHSNLPSSWSIELALAALREKAERINGCEYCDDNFKFWQTQISGELPNARFCPMCGKKLPVYAGTIGGEIVQHAMKEMEK